MHMKIANDDEFVRDAGSNGIINIDVRKHDNFLRERRAALEMQTLAAEVKSMKSDFGAIKDLLTQLVRDK
jgi:hypothetical protein